MKTNFTISSRSRKILLFTFAIVLLFLLFALTLMVGPVNLFSLQNSDLAKNILLQQRLPQAIVALVVGATLAASGLLLQHWFRNPLADPSILGISSGASLAIALVLLGSNSLSFQLANTLSYLAAPIGALLTLIPLLIIAKLSQRPSFLLIFGLMMSFLTNSIITLLMNFASATQIKRYMSWTFGNFSSVPLNQIPFFLLSLLLPLLCIQFLLPGLKKLQLGMDYAQSMGLRIHSFQLALLLLSSFVVGAATFFCGPISFVAIAAAQFSRSLLKSSNPYLIMPMTLLFGANLALFSQFLSNLSPSGPLPVNAILAIIGVPVILATLIKEVKQS